MSSSAPSAPVVRLPVAPRIIPRAEHNISRDSISERALKVLYRLKNAGYLACLVGGSVRDLLLGREPKDFDVATNARPEQVRELFKNCRLIGRRFRLAHVHFGNEIIEVATFRANTLATASDARVIEEDGRILRDNVYGTIDDDVWRRDFTVNALYYNIEDFSVIDYVGGMADIAAGQLRLIGDPDVRYREDPVRLLRAVRFAAKLGFRIHPDTETPLHTLGELLDVISPSRLFEEMLKLFLAGKAVQSFELLRHYGLFGRLFPEVEESLGEEEAGFPKMLLVKALENTDRRLAEDKPVTPAFLLAALLWAPVQRRTRQYQAQEHPPAHAAELAQDDAIARQIARVAMPRRFTQMAREIWLLQHPLEQRVARSVVRWFTHPRFRAGYDFLVLRAEAGEPVREAADWWTAFQQATENTRAEMIAALPQPAPGSGRKRRRRGGRHRHKSAPV
ncbi:MAG TPA: polynucleotide adenylyltransferase PcnB [Gammaproteobacteria bacterium]|nr:polynucleotide adenylyltransferase PcnB [Gammaproteobacteria bacterium]